MASINYAIREISVKIVYYGCGLGGKTTNLQVIHRKIPVDYRSDMVSLATETDRTLFFDFLPLDLGKIKGFSTKFQLYTVPGQVYYNATRKLVLRGVDGVVFVVDSAQDKLQENIESFQNLHDNLAEYGIKQGTIPIIIQYNKRDLPNAMDIATLDKMINKYSYPWNEAIANQGKGVFESLKMIGKIVIDNLNKKYSRPSFSQPQEPSRPKPSFTTQSQYYVPKPTPAQDLSTHKQDYYSPNTSRMTPPPVSTPPPKPKSSDDIFYQPKANPPPPQQQNINPSFSPKSPISEKPSSPNDYYNYGSINLEPMEQQSGSVVNTPFEPIQKTASAPQVQPPPTKTELDLEIEKYQKEIEEKQRGLKSFGPQMEQENEFSSQKPQARFTPPPKESYNVYEIPPQKEQIPSYPMKGVSSSEEYTDNPNIDEQGQGEGNQQLYFTSINPDRQKKKIKKPVNPKTKQAGGFFSKLFNKDKT